MYYTFIFMLGRGAAVRLLLKKAPGIAATVFCFLKKTPSSTVPSVPVEFHPLDVVQENPLFSRKSKLLCTLLI